MLNDDFINRKQYISKNNELNKKFEEKFYREGAKKKAELDQKLEAMSINNEILFSGQIARKKVLDAAADVSLRSSYFVNSFVEESESEENNEQTKSNKKIVQSEFNRGKQIADNIKEQEKNNSKNKFSI